MLPLFKKFKEGLAKTVTAISTRTHGLFGGRKIDAASIEELEEALYKADFGVETTAEIVGEIREACRRDKELQGRRAAEIGAAVLQRVLEGSAGVQSSPPRQRAKTAAPEPRSGAEAGREKPAAPSLASPPALPLNSNPTVIVLIGVNGSGKTTTCAKLGWRLKGEGLSVMLAAADTFRAAAVEQLKTWAQRLDLAVVAGHTGADAASVAFDAWRAAKARGCDVLIVDTAGRLHTKDNLMGELSKIRRVLQKNDPAAPHHRWLVVDGSLGANSIEQARVFHQSFGLTGLVVTKLDGTSRGGALVGIYRQLKIPIYFLGLGEQAEDLQPFNVENYANAVFGLESQNSQEISP